MDQQADLADQGHGPVNPFDIIRQNIAHARRRNAEFKAGLPEAERLSNETLSDDKKAGIALFACMAGLSIAGMVRTTLSQGGQAVSSAHCEAHFAQHLTTMLGILSVLLPLYVEVVGAAGALIDDDKMDCDVDEWLDLIEAELSGFISRSATAGSVH